MILGGSYGKDTSRGWAETAFPFFSFGFFDALDCASCIAGFVAASAVEWTVEGAAELIVRKREIGGQRRFDRATRKTRRWKG